METNEVAKSMQEDENSGEIVALLSSSTNRFQIYSASASGYLSIWDYLDGSKLKVLLYCWLNVHIDVEVRCPVAGGLCSSFG
jgi:hypothetical protein